MNLEENNGVTFSVFSFLRFFSQRKKRNGKKTAENNNKKSLQKDSNLILRPHIVNVPVTFN